MGLPLPITDDAGDVDVGGLQANANEALDGIAEQALISWYTTSLHATPLAEDGAAPGRRSTREPKRIE